MGGPGSGRRPGSGKAGIVYRTRKSVGGGKGAFSALVNSKGKKAQVSDTRYAKFSFSKSKSKR